MFRSLRGRLIVLLLLLVAAAIGAGMLMVGLFRQSATAQAGQAEAEIGRACDAIAGAYRFYTAGSQEPPSGSSDESLRRGLGAVVLTALRDRAGIEGGIWQAGAGSLAYAFPTYQGAEPKTDVPQAELPRIQAINRTALGEDRQAIARYDATSQILLLTACPLPGAIPGLTAWTMTRVFTFAGRSYRQLMAGLAILFSTVLAAAALLTRLTITWSRHVAQIERTLQTREVAELPVLHATGELELDRIVTALNEAGRRVVEARQRADRLARQVAAGERLTAIGRVAAGVAHEIRNPIAAMRLRAENALAGDPERKRRALAMILEQIERLDGLVRRLLSVTERDEPRPRCVALAPFLDACIASNGDLAAPKEIRFERAGEEGEGYFDPEQMRGALDNLMRNAIHAAPARSRILVAARRDDGNLVLSVHDQGEGPPPKIRDHLFEPFVTGRADGTGLGLSIVHEVATAHGGTARLAGVGPGTTFEIVLPWQPS
jgi:signal transduction histidine kinase